MPTNAGISLTSSQLSTLRSARLERELTQGDVAGRLGVTQGMVALYEAGKRRPPIEVLRAWAAIVGYEAWERQLELRQRTPKP